jgi:hypothetical protein
LKFTFPTLNTLHDAVVRYGGIGWTYYSNPPEDTQMIWLLGGASLTIQDCVIEQRPVRDQPRPGAAIVVRPLSPRPDRHP